MRTLSRPIAALILSLACTSAFADEPAKADAAGGGWSATTKEAAATPENKAVLDKGQAKSVTGEVVDVSCFLQLGKRGPKHKDCGSKCVKNGAPVGLVDDGGKLYLLMPEEHHPRRDGKASLQEWGAKHMGDTVSLSGMLQSQNGTEALYIATPAQ